MWPTGQIGLPTGTSTRWPGRSGGGRSCRVKTDSSRPHSRHRVVSSSCRSIRHRLLGIGSSPGSHESGAVTARLTMVQLGEPHGGDLGTFALALPTLETAVRATHPFD